MADSPRSAASALVGMCAVLCFVNACRSQRHRDDTAARHAHSVPATAAASSSGLAPLPSVNADGEAVTLDEAGARRFVERWAKVQNAHDFTAYSALYAERFTGLKRVGTYAKRFDRRGWLADRRPMLREGTSVRLSEIQVSLSPSAARILLTQDFSAPGFHDSGPKELFLTAVGRDIVISREEMLVSRVAVSPPSSNGAVLAFHRDGPVLALGVEGGALKGQPHLLARGPSDSYDVALALSAGDVDAATRGWLGRSLTAYAKDGARCSGAVVRFELRVSAQPHFGMIQAWNGEAGEPKATAAQIAGDIWRIARDDERFVVGVLDHPCRGVWATEGTQPWVAALPAPAPLRARAMAAFKALPRYRELQTEFVTERSDAQHGWEEIDGEVSVVVVRPASEPAIVIVSASGGVSCNSFSGRLSAIWKVAEGGSLDLRQVLETGDLLHVHGALEHAAAPLELLAGPDGLSDDLSVLQPAAVGYERRVLFSSSFWDCGC